MVRRRVAAGVRSLVRQWWTPRKQRLIGLGKTVLAGWAIQLGRDVLQDRRDGLLNQGIDKVVGLLTGNPDGSAVVAHAASLAIDHTITYLPFLLPVLYIAWTLDR